ncbi:MAG: DedA family protein [Polyangiaceae bacterium]
MPAGLVLAGADPVTVVGAVFLVTLSTIIVPIPEEAVLLGAGYAARQGRAPLVACFAAAWLAVMLGDALSYFVGRAMLARVLRTGIGRILMPEPRRAWAERTVHRHGTLAIVVARFFVGLRGFLYIAIGASKVPLPRFALVNAAAGVAEIGGLVAIGYAFGELSARVGTRIDVALVAIVLSSLAASAAVRVWINGRT